MFLFVVEINSCLFRANTAKDGGGGVYSVETHLHIKNTEFFQTASTLNIGAALMIEGVVEEVTDTENIVVEDTTFSYFSKRHAFGSDLTYGYIVYATTKVYMHNIILKELLRRLLTLRI